MELCCGSNNMEVQKKKRKSRRNKLEFLGWGSKPLIEFLDSIGKESRQYSQREVESIVKEYAASNNLIDPKKKRKFLCDEKLFKLFRKRTISRMKVHNLLEVHFIENHDDSSDEERGREEEKVSSKKPKAKKTAASKKKDVPKAPRSCFAALTSQNIKLLYLKRSLVQNLLKNNPESFEDKIVGSIVRVSSELNYNIKKHPFQLQQVTGVTRSSGSGNTALETCLRLSNVMADVPISKLQEGNFSEEECEEFHEQVKAGLLKRPTVEEFELKAQALHRDITQHWINKEINSLQHRMDHANEKGWRDQFYEYSNRREHLSKSDEQERLLSQKPIVAAEEPEHKETPMAASEKVEEKEEEEEKSCSEKSEQENLSMKKLKAVAEEQEPESVKVEEESSCTPLDVQKEMEDRANYARSVIRAASDMSAAGLRLAEGDYAGNVTVMQPYYPGLNYLGEYSAVLRNNITGMHPNYLGEMCWHNGMAQAQLLQQPPQGIQTTIGVDPNAAIWCGADHRGIIQGPVSLNALRIWFHQGYLGTNFWVWKIGQNQGQSVLLVDLLNNSSSQ